MTPDVVAALKWYAVLLLLGLAGWPLTFKLFARLPERGYALSKAVGLLLTGYGLWFLGSLGLLANDLPSILLALGLVAGLGAAWLGRTGFKELTTWVRRNWPLVLGVEILFALAFAGLALFRAYNPEINGTEKPMEFMFLNAILRAPTFPPHDAWLAGHAISYYYFGYVLIAVLTRLAAVEAAIAFNLGLATVFALTTVNAWSVVYNLMVLHTQAETTRPELVEGPPELVAGLPRFTFFPALLAPLFVLLVGNFYGFAHLLYANGVGGETQVWAPYYDFGDPALGAAPNARVGAQNVWAWLDLKQMALPAPPPRATFNWDTGYNWFFGARVVHDRNLVGQATEAIDENPAFSFVLGDLHPHVLALPFAVLAAALALQWGLWTRASGFIFALATLTEPTASAAARFRALLPWVFSALLLGALIFLNTWDFPIYFFLLLFAVVSNWAAIGAGFKGAYWPLTLGLGLLAVLSVLFYFPFLLTFQSQAGGFLPNLIYPTRFQQTLVFFGPVLIGLALWLGWLTWTVRAQLNRRVAGWVGGGVLAVVVGAALLLALGASLNPGVMALVTSFIAPLQPEQAWGLVLQRRLVDSWATLFPVLVIGLSVGLAVKGVRFVAPPPGEARTVPPTFDPAVLFGLALATTGALLLLGPEWLYLRDNFGTRMNTIFKFYFQVWNLWALAWAFGLWMLFRRGSLVMAVVAAVLTGLLVAGGLLYTVPSAWSRANGFKSTTPTLDGMRYFADSYPADWAMVEWLQANVTGTPVIAEAPGGAYNVEESRMAMATGLPTVIGWVNHEGQWRGDYYEKVAERPGALGTLYREPDWATTQAMLDRYAIEYVYIGAEERAQFRPSVRKFITNMELVVWAQCGVHPTTFRMECELHPGSDLALSADPVATLQQAEALLFRRKAAAP